LTYQWRFNGATIPGATGTGLALTNVQPANAGNYVLVVSNATAVVTSSIASVSVLINQSTQVIYSEDFDSPSGNTNWNVFDGAANGISDYTLTWAYDYSAYFSAYNNAFIPPAPASVNGTTRGVRLTVNNNDGTAATAGVSLYPKNLNLSGAFAIKFDLWINYPGGAGGGTGSTEYPTFGLNHTGTRVNWDSSTVNPSDGVWFAVDGEGGDSGGKDYRAYEGSASGRPTLLSFAASGFSASGAVSANNTDPFFQSIFSSPAYETSGSPGKRWVQVEIDQDTNNVITWRLNGDLIAQRQNTSPFTNGTVMLGYMDVFSSIASPAADAFVLFDNLRVEVAAPPIAPAITSQPQNTSVYPAQDAAFTVAATGSAPLSFQWRFNGTNIPGATANVFTRAAVQAQDVGLYSVTISNSVGSVTSSNALLLLIDSPYLSAVSATPGDRGALISWHSVVPASSQVQFEASGVQINAALGNGGFSRASSLDPATVTNHVVLLAGLTPNTLYSFQVLSTADTNTYVSGVYQFKTLPQLSTTNIPPAWWQTFFFGGTNDPNADPDADGYSIAQEYILGSNPTNAASRLLLLGESGSNSLRITFWPLVEDRNYQLLFKPDVNGTIWQTSSVNPSSTVDGRGLFTLPLTNSNRGFYRLKVELGNNTTNGFALPASKSISSYASDPICGPNRAYVR
jgi:hypothetical protein